MADVLGANMTKYDAGAGSSNWIDSQDVKTKEFVFKDSYEAASLAIGSTITIAELPAGAKVSEVKIYFDALGASSTLSAGDSDDADRYFAAASTANAGVLSLDLADGFNYEIGTNDGDNRILLTTAGATITGTIKSVVRYTV